MDRLYRGIRKFQQEHFRGDEDFYLNIDKGQAPDTLFIACSDSRVDPNLITQSKPGELFIVKNVGNIIPACDSFYKKTCTAAAIEFAINMLDIAHIVVCGHSNCGAIKALFGDEKELAEMDNLKEWIDTLKAVKQRSFEKAVSLSYEDIIAAAEQEHIKTQLAHLKTYPLVRKALAEGKVTLHGWHYEIGTGTIHCYNEAKDAFDRINHNEEDREPTAGSFEEPCGDMG